MKTKRVNSDIYGNPRYVIHFSSFLNDTEKENKLKNRHIAIYRAYKFGAKEYKGKDFGGGVVFQSYNIDSDIKRIKEIVNKETGKQNKFLTYHRNPTAGEIKFGEGAIHYKDFAYTDCQKDNGDFKTWLICPIDGLRYYR